MTTPDLNLLITLDVLLTEGSVARAAQRLRLSPSAMSRALARLRETTGDPLLVRAGRGLVPTPRALELRQTVGEVVQAAQTALRPAQTLDLQKLERSFTFRTREGFVENFGADLIRRLRDEAPGVRLWFKQKTDKSNDALRDGSVDLETGVVGKETRPEVRMRALFQDRFIGVVRAGHPLCGGEIPPARFAAYEHIFVSRKGDDRGAVDEALQTLGLERKVIAIVGGFSTALSLSRASDWVAVVPERYTGNLRDGLFSFALPVTVPEITISLLWHPRMDADPAHRWLRQCVSEVCSNRQLKSQLSNASR